MKGQVDQMAQHLSYSCYFLKPVRTLGFVNKINLYLKEI